MDAEPIKPLMLSRLQFEEEEKKERALNVYTKWMEGIREQMEASRIGYGEKKKGRWEKDEE